MWMCTCVQVLAEGTRCPGGRGAAANHLKWVLDNWTPLLCKSSKCSQLWAISPAPGWATFAYLEF